MDGQGGDREGGERRSPLKGISDASQAGRGQQASVGNATERRLGTHAF